MDPKTSKIEPTVQYYFSEGIAQKIPNRKNPGTTYAVYTEYESDYMGEYTYFIGEEVTSFENTPQDLSQLVIAPQIYAKFTTEQGQMPGIIIDAWQKIWKMSDNDLGGTRNYRADFEIYDERARDYHNAIVDIYVGIKT